MKKFDAISLAFGIAIGWAVLHVLPISSFYSRDTSDPERKISEVRSREDSITVTQSVIDEISSKDNMANY